VFVFVFVDMLSLILTHEDSAWHSRTARIASALVTVAMPLQVARLGCPSLTGARSTARG
jgi:hypothetical protein